MATKHLSRSLRVLAAAVAILLAGNAAAIASHRFADVPDSNTHHDAIDTIARAGISLGCGGANYCPDGFVRRDQMASFLARALQKLTPVHVSKDFSSGPLDIDAGPIVCVTPPHTPTVAARAFLSSWVSARPESSVPMNFYVRQVYSTDGGASWIWLDGGAVSRAGSDHIQLWANASQFDTLNLVQGTSYIFGVRVSRGSGETEVDVADHRCEVMAEITYRDAGPSTL